MDYQSPCGYVCTIYRSKHKFPPFEAPQHKRSHNQVYLLIKQGQCASKFAHLVLSHSSVLTDGEECTLNEPQTIVEVAGVKQGDVDDFRLVATRSGINRMATWEGKWQRHIPLPPMT